MLHNQTSIARTMVSFLTAWWVEKNSLILNTCNNELYMYLFYPHQFTMYLKIHIRRNRMQVHCTFYLHL